MSERKQFESSFRLRHTDPNLADSLLGFDVKQDRYEIGYTNESFLSWQAAKSDVSWFTPSDRKPDLSNADDFGCVWVWRTSDPVVEKWHYTHLKNLDDAYWMAIAKSTKPQPPKD